MNRLLATHSPHRRGLRRARRCVALVWRRRAAHAIAPELDARSRARRERREGQGDRRARRVRRRRARSPLLQALLDGEVQTAGEHGAARQGRRGHRSRDRRQGRRRCPSRATTSSSTTACGASSPPRSPRCKLVVARPRDAARRRARRCRAAPTRTMLPAIQRALAKEQDPEIKALLTLTQATVQLASSDKPTRLAAIRALAESPRSQHQDAAAAAAREEGRRLRRARRRRPRRSRAVAARDREPARDGRDDRPRLQRHQPRQHPAARRARPRDHLRPDGRHQHGARRAHHDRRLRDLRRAEPVPRATCRARSTSICSRRCRWRSPRRRSSAWCSSAR